MSVGAFRRSPTIVVVDFPDLVVDNSMLLLANLFSVFLFGIPPPLKARPLLLIVRTPSKLQHVPLDRLSRTSNECGVIFAAVGYRCTAVGVHSNLTGGGA